MQKGCELCKNSQAFDVEISMAFQPIIDVANSSIFAYEALVRGVNNEGAGEVFKHVRDNNIYTFDQACRVKAIQLASQLRIDTKLSINFMPNAVYEPARCLRSTLNAASEYDFPLSSLIFEFTENEQISDSAHICNIIDRYKETGFMTALDDFGAGFCGLRLLAEVPVDIIKIDMALIRDIDSNSRKRSILNSIMLGASELNSQVIAEGVETEDEFKTLHNMGVTLFQGYYFAKPGFETLPQVDFAQLQAVL